MIRQIFAVLLALCVLFSAVLCFADDLDDDDLDEDEDGIETLDDGYEEEEQTVDFKTVSTYNIETMTEGYFNLKMNADHTGAILTSYTGEDSEVIFPETVKDGIPVVAIDDGMCSDNPKIENIRIPGSIKTIGNAAFARCPKLKSVIIEEGVLSLGMCCFGGCPELTDVNLPNSIEIVDNFVFARCIALEEVVFGTELQSIGIEAFRGCINLRKITIPGGDNVSFGDRIFEECPNEVEIAN